MTIKKQSEPEPMLAEYVDLKAMAAAADEERPRENESMLAEFLDIAPAPGRVTGRATPAEIMARRVFLDVADRLGAPVDRGEAA